MACFMAASAGDVDPKLMKGWEADSEYNKLYDVREFEKLRVWFVRAKEVIPMPGMSPATAIDVLEGAELIEVQLCPTWYRKPDEIPLKKDDRIKIKGVWAEINGKDVFMASKIKKDPDFDIIKVRLTKDGTPFWTMTPEQRDLLGGKFYSNSKKKNNNNRRNLIFPQYAAGHRGHAYSEQQIIDMLAAAGAKDIQRLAVRTPDDSDVISGIV